MKKNHLGFLKAIIILITISLSHTLIFSLTVEDIINKSRTDPEFAWDMYLLYISNQVSSNKENIDKLGQFLYAKRKLRDYEFAIKEDIEGLINFLQSNILDNTIKYYLLSIFSEENLFKYVQEKIDSTPNVLYLFSLIKNYDSEAFSERLLNILLRNTKMVPNYIQVLSKVQNSEILISGLINHLKRKFNTTNNNNDKNSYLEIYEQIVAIYPQYKDQTFDKSLSLKTFSFSSFWKNVLDLSKSKIHNLMNSKKLFKIITMLSLSLAFLLLLLLPIVRYYIYSLFQSWKMAALVYKKIVEKDPLNEEKRLKLAQLYEKAGMYEEAMNEYNFLKRIKIE